MALLSQAEQLPAEACLPPALHPIPLFRKLPNTILPFAYKSYSPWPCSPPQPCNKEMNTRGSSFWKVF